MLKPKLKLLTARQGERIARPFRAGRLFNENGQWYFQTREGFAQGPYEDRVSAEAAIKWYIRSQDLPRVAS